MEDRRGELLLREVERRISQENLVSNEKPAGAPAAAAGPEGPEGAEVIASQSSYDN
jgi:hypothetical protein